MPEAARQKATNAISASIMSWRWVSTPAAPGAANTSTFLAHCLGRASTSSASRNGRGLRGASGRGGVTGSAADPRGAGAGAGSSTTTSTSTSSGATPATLEGGGGAASGTGATQRSDTLRHTGRGRWRKALKT